MSAARRYSWSLVLKELAGAQSTLGRADRKCGRKDAEYLDQLQRARLAIASAWILVRALRRGARRDERRRAAA